MDKDALIRWFQSKGYSDPAHAAERVLWHLQEMEPQRAFHRQDLDYKEFEAFLAQEKEAAERAEQQRRAAADLENKKKAELKRITEIMKREPAQNPSKAAIPRQNVSLIGNKVEPRIAQEGKALKNRSMSTLLKASLPTLFNKRKIPTDVRHRFIDEMKGLAPTENEQLRKFNIGQLVDATFGNLTPEEKDEIVERMDSTAQTYATEFKQHEKNPSYLLPPNIAQTVEDYQAMQTLAPRDRLLDRLMEEMENPPEEPLYPKEKRFAPETERQKIAKAAKEEILGYRRDLHGHLVMPGDGEPSPSERAQWLHGSTLNRNASQALREGLSPVSETEKRIAAGKHYENAYLDDIIQHMKEDQERDWKERIEPSLMGQFIKSGSVKGGIHRTLHDRARLEHQKNLEKSIMQLKFQAAREGLGHAEREMQDRMAASQAKAQAELQEAAHLRQGAQEQQQMAENDLKQNLYRANELEKLGEAEQAEQQREKDYEYAHHLEEKMAPKRAEAKLMELTGGHAPTTPFQEMEHKRLEIPVPLKSPAAQMGNLIGQMGAQFMATRPQTFAQGGSVKAYGLGELVRRNGYASGGHPVGTPSQYQLEDYAKWLTQKGPNPMWMQVSHAFAQGLANPYEFGSFGKGLQKGLDATTEDRKQQAERYYKAAHIHKLVEESREAQAERERKFREHQDELEYKYAHLGEIERYHQAHLGVLGKKATQGPTTQIRMGKDGTPYAVRVDPETGHEEMVQIPGMPSGAEIASDKKAQEGAMRGKSILGFFNGENQSIANDREYLALRKKGLSHQEAQDRILGLKTATPPSAEELQQRMDHYMGGT